MLDSGHCTLLRRERKCQWCEACLPGDCQAACSATAPERDSVRSCPCLGATPAASQTPFFMKTIYCYCLRQPPFVILPTALYQHRHKGSLSLLTCGCCMCSICLEWGNSRKKKGGCSLISCGISSPLEFLVLAGNEVKWQLQRGSSGVEQQLIATPSLPHLLLLLSQDSNTDRCAVWAFYKQVHRQKRVLLIHMALGFLLLWCAT